VLVLENQFSENYGYIVHDSSTNNYVTYLGTYFDGNLQTAEFPTWTTDNANGLSFNGSQVATVTTTFSLFPDVTSYSNSATFSFWMILRRSDVKYTRTVICIVL